MAKSKNPAPVATTPEPVPAVVENSHIVWRRDNGDHYSYHVLTTNTPDQCGEWMAKNHPTMVEDENFAIVAETEYEAWKNGQEEINQNRSGEETQPSGEASPS